MNDSLKERTYLMQLKSAIIARSEQNWLARLDRCAALATAVLAFAPTVVVAAGPASGPVQKSDAVSFESIPGTTVKRVILTPKAAERLGIETGKVSEEEIIQQQMVGGRVILSDQVVQQPPASAGFGSFGRVTAPKETKSPPPPGPPHQRWVVVTLTKGEWERLRKDKPARILPLATRQQSEKGVLALPSGIPPVEDPKRSMLQVYYKVPGNEDLKPYERVRVELEQTGKDGKRKVAPYSALYYDARGDAWVYTNPKPLVFERQRVDVERIAGDWAVLTDGPPVGTPVVTTGAALLYGAEVVFKK